MSQLDEGNYWGRSMNRRSLLRASGLGAAGLAGAALFGCSDGAKEDGGGQPAAGGAAKTGGSTVSIKRGGKLTVAVGAEPLGSLNPHRGQGGGDHKFFWTMYEGLVQYNRDGVPDTKYSLADSFEAIDPTTIKFTLRPGVKYHDGTTMKAEDIRYNIGKVQSEAYKSAARSQILPVQKIDVIDDRTAIFKLDRPNAALLTLLGDRGGQMVSPTALEKGVEAFDRKPLGGTGPFRFVEWVSDARVRVQKNPDYWRKGVDGNALPYLDEIEWKVIPDANVALASVESGEIDVAVPPLSEMDRLEKAGQYQLSSFIGSSWSGMYFNLKLAPTDDVNLRRAIAYAIDREAENKALNFGRFQVATGILTPAAKWAYEPVASAPKFDLAKAKEFLAKSKYPNGTKITVTIATSQEAAIRAALWQDMLKKINVQLELLPLQTYTNRMWVTQDVNALQAGFSIRADPDGTLSEVVHTKGFYNAGHFENPQLDDIIAKARESYDTKERKRYYQEAEKILADQVYDVYSTYSAQFRVARKRVQNTDLTFGAEGKERYDEIWVNA